MSVSIHIQQSWPSPQLCERVLVSIRGLPILQERDVIALFTQQGPFLSLQKVPVGLAALLPVPQHQNLQSKSQLCLLCVCHNNTDVSIGSIVFVVMQLCHLLLEDANVHVLQCCRLYFRVFGLHSNQKQPNVLVLKCLFVHLGDYTMESKSPR